LRKRLRLPFVAKVSRFRADDLPYNLPGDTKITAYRLDRLTEDEIGATDLRNRLHDQHSNLGSHENGSQCGPSVRGSRLEADHPENGVLIPCRNTPPSMDPVRAINGSWVYRLRPPSTSIFDSLSRCVDQALRSGSPALRAPSSILSNKSGL